MSTKKLTETKITPGLRIVIGLIMLLVSYGFASLAIDSGSLWAYLLAFACLCLGFVNLKISVKEIYSKNDKRTKTS
jgi:hypothetical protein